MKIRITIVAVVIAVIFFSPRGGLYSATAGNLCVTGRFNSLKGDLLEFDDNFSILEFSFEEFKKELTKERPIDKIIIQLLGSNTSTASVQQMVDVLTPGIRPPRNLK